VEGADQPFGLEIVAAQRWMALVPFGRFMAR
jgi:hypothetical protein